MSDKYEMNGQIKTIGETKTFGSDFQVREFVIETADEKYPQKVKFQVIKEGCEKLGDDFNEGDNVTVAFNIRGKELDDGRVFNNLQAWRIVAQEGKQTVTQAKSEAEQAIVDKVQESVGGDDNLPF